MAIQKKFGNRLMDLPLGEHDFTLEAIAQQQVRKLRCKKLKFWWTVC
jgi:hypothetical protein